MRQQPTKYWLVIDHWRDVHSIWTIHCQAQKFVEQQNLQPTSELSKWTVKELPVYPSIEQGEECE